MEEAFSKNLQKGRDFEEIVYYFCCDGLKGLPEAVETYFPQTVVQTCVVHLIRRSLSFVNFKDRKTVASDLKPIYQAATETEALLALEQFQIKCVLAAAGLEKGKKCPLALASKRRAA